jgi:hypothetical protein
MAAKDEIAERLEGFKKSGLITAYEVMEVDDSIRVRITAPRNQQPADVKQFVVESLSGLLSGSQINAEAWSG